MHRLIQRRVNLSTAFRGLAGPRLGDRLGDGLSAWLVASSRGVEAPEN